MLRIEKILCPTDFSGPAAQALDEAVEVAKRFGAEVHLFHAVTLVGDLHGTPDTEDHRGQGHRTPEEVLAELAVRVEGEGLRALPAQRRGLSPGVTICEYVQEKGIDLIVMGTHGRRGLRRVLLGSVAEEVLHCTLCPVLTVRPKPAETAPEPRPTVVRSILAPIDFSASTPRALAYARELAAAFGAELEVLHVVPLLPVPNLYGPRHADSPSQREPGLHERLLSVVERRMESGPGPRVPFQAHVVDGRAASQILHFAESRSCDLIVMASHGLTGLRHLALGSTAEEVIRDAPCPVFVFKTFGRSLLSDDAD